MKEKILRFEFVADKQLWTVKIDKIDDDTMVVTTSFVKTIKNRSKRGRLMGGYYTVNDFSFSKGSSKILECAIECEGKTITEFDVKEQNNKELIATTKEVNIKPGGTARVFGRAEQYRRANDLAFETFTTPAINPQIEVIIPPDLEHRVQFGTPGDYTKEEYAIDICYLAFISRASSCLFAGGRRMGKPALHR